MPEVARQFSLSSLLWFLFGTGAFLSAWVPHNPAGAVVGCLLLSLFYWRADHRDVLAVHFLFFLPGVAIVALECAWRLAAPGDWQSAEPGTARCLEVSSLVANLISYPIYLLSLLARQA
jgi:hypothetical protein